MTRISNEEALKGGMAMLQWMEQRRGDKGDIMTMRRFVDAVVKAGQRSMKQTSLKNYFSSYDETKYYSVNGT